MTDKQNHLESVQERIDILQETIAERERDIRERARRFQENLEHEISPAEIVRRHPWPSAFAALGLGYLTGRMLRSGGPAPSAESCQLPETGAPALPATRTGGALADLRLELIRSAKELGVNYLQRYLDSKFRKTPQHTSQD